MKTVILNRVEKARGPVGFIGEERISRHECHYGVTFECQPDGSLVAEVEDEVAAEMVGAGRVVIQA
jgi:hypothetical protein